MIPIIALFIVATITIAAVVLGPRVADQRVVFDDAPDQPCAFGPDMAWIALKTENCDAVVEAIGLLDPVASNWSSGIGTVYDRSLGENRLFVSPPVNGWIFVIGSSLPHPHGRTFIDKCTPLLLHLSQAFPEVQYFASYPELDLFAWAKGGAGRLVRAFGVSDEGVVWVRGRTTREERQLGLKLFELRGVRGRRGDAGGELLMHPTQEHVMRLAGQWSVNPTLLDLSPFRTGRGYVGFAPAEWRAQRHRMSA